MAGFFDERLGPTVSGAKDAWQQYVEETEKNRLAHLAGVPIGSLSEVGKLAGALKATIAVPAEALTQVAAKATGATSLRGQAAVDVPKVELPRVNVEDPKVANWLQVIYGKNGEHWDESPEQAFETSEGRARLAAIKHLVTTDPAYQERRAYWKERITDPVDRWNTMFAEYKESRKPDASIVPKTYAGWAAEQGLITAATGGLAEAPAIAQGLSKGVPLAKLLRTAAVEASPAAFARDAARVGVLGGSALAQLAKAVPMQTGFLTGAAIGAIENPEHPFLGAAGGAALGTGAGAVAERLGAKLAGTALDRAASSLGSKLFAAAARDPRRWEQLLGAGNYPGMSMLGGAVGAGLVGAMDETNPEEKALLNAAIGLGIPATAKYLTKIPFPGLSRIGMSLAPTGAGAVLGAIAGNTIAPPEDDETFLGQAAKGALGGAIAANVAVGGARALGVGAQSVLYETGGDFHKAGAFLARLIPLDVVRNLKNPATGKPMFAHPIGLLQQASDNVAMEVHQETQKIAEVLQAIPASKRTSAQFRSDLFKVMRATGAKGAVKNPAALFGVDDDALNLAHHLRGEFDRLFWEKVERGDLKREQYREGYIPSIIDMKEFRRHIQGRFLRSPTAVQRFRASLPDEFLKSEAAKAIAEDPRNLALFNPDQLPQHFGPREAQALQQVFQRAEAHNIEPRSVLEILSSRKPIEAEDINLLAALRGAVGKEAPPENIFDATLLERKEGTKLPLLDDPLRAYLRDVEKNARKRNFGPLIEPVKDPETGKVLSESPIQASLREMGGKFPEHQKVLVDVTKSVMGYPRPIDEAMDTIAETIFKDPESWRVGSRMLKDLTYAGALGLKPAAAVRNLFSYMMTGSALGKDDAISGALVAQKDWNFWRNEAIQNRALANEFADELDEIREVLPGGLGMFSEKSREFAQTMLKMQHFTEERFRTWTNTSAMLKVLRERGNFDPSYLRGVDAAGVRKMIAAAQKTNTNEAWWDVARLVGKKTTDLVAWRYGPAGQGVIPQGRTTKLFAMFSSWPLNYASLLLHWGSEGRVQHIVNMGVAAALVDKMALEGLGLTRTTGLTAMGEGQEKDVFNAIPSGPIDTSLAPIPRAALGAGQALSGALSQDRGAWREGTRAVTRNVPTIFGLGRVEPAWRGMKDAEDERKKEALIRLLYGGTPQRLGDAE